MQLRVPTSRYTVQSMILTIAALVSSAAALGIEAASRSWWKSALLDDKGSKATLQLTSEEQRTLKRMQWWAPATAPLEPSDKYVLFTGDVGGPNNIRIGWEMTGVVAQATGRTLVLPPAWSMYLLDWGPMTLRPKDLPPSDTKTSVEDLVNLQQLKGYLPTLTWEEFTQRTGFTWDAAREKAAEVPVESMCQLNAYKTITATILFMSGSGGRREGFTCGDWAERGGPNTVLNASMTDAGWALLTHGFVWHEDMFAVAAKVVNFLGLFQYNAMHARYNDFQFHGYQQSAKFILKDWAPVFGPRRNLYIASDEPERFQNLSTTSGLQTFIFKDMLSNPSHELLKDIKAQFDPLRWFKMLGPIEELICTYSRIFVGTGSSSFSGHINRMRVHAKAPVTRVLKHKEPVPADDIRAEIKAWEDGHLDVAFAPDPPTTGDSFLDIRLRAAP